MTLINQQDFETPGGQQKIVAKLHQLEQKVHHLEQRLEQLEQTEGRLEADLKGPEAY